jgi:uncharacterized SAM-binding protein YcdF (DUF218 family)
MFFILSKLLPPLIYPLGLAVILVALGLVLHRKRRLAWMLIGSALVILFISSNAWVAQGLARSLEWRYLPEGEITEAPVILVLGGGTQPATPPRTDVEVSGAGDRVIYAARLYREGKAPIILVTGGRQTFSGEKTTTPADEMAELLVFMGVPEDAIWLESKSLNTYENALFSAQMLEEKNINKVILVTSAMHMPRSVPLFEKQGLQVIPAPTDYTTTKADNTNRPGFNLPSFLGKLMPSSYNLELTTGALKELIGILVYRLKGWM